MRQTVIEPKLEPSTNVSAFRGESGVCTRTRLLRLRPRRRSEGANASMIVAGNRMPEYRALDAMTMSLAPMTCGNERSARKSVPCGTYVD